MAHAQIEVGFRILEYLEPDSVFKPKKLDQSIIEAFLKQDVVGAVGRIIRELNINDKYEIEREAVEFANEVLVDFIEKKEKEKISERERLLIRLGELDYELNNE